MRWKATVVWLEPNVVPPTIASSFQTTVVGALSGFLLPPQFGTAAARWAVAAKDGSPASWAVRSTVYEQLFDVLVLLAAGSAGLTCLMFAASTTVTVFAVGLSLALVLILAQPVLRVTAQVVRKLAEYIVSWGVGAEATALGFFLTRAAQMPSTRIIPLLVYSIVRLLLQMMHGVALASVFAPMARAHLVAAGIPASIMAFVIPVSPGGLGVAEWTWSGLLVLAGATQLAAANTALSNRVIYLVALLVAVLLSGMLGIMLSRLHRRPT